MATGGLNALWKIFSARSRKEGAKAPLTADMHIDLGAGGILFVVFCLAPAWGLAAACAMQTSLSATTGLSGQLQYHLQVLNHGT